MEGPANLEEFRGGGPVYRHLWCVHRDMWCAVGIVTCGVCSVTCGVCTVTCGVCTVTCGVCTATCGVCTVTCGAVPSPVECVLGVGGWVNVCLGALRLQLRCVLCAAAWPRWGLPCCCAAACQRLREVCDEVALKPRVHMGVP